MNRFVVRAAAAALVAVLVAQASAHFVYVDSQPTDKGLLVKSGFGEPSGWDPDLVTRMSNSTFWTRTGGALKEIQVPLDEKEQEYRTTLAGPAPDAVLAATDFGVIAFGGNPPSWLRYTAKHLVGTPERWNDETPTKELRIEVLARREGDDVVLRVLHLGKPLAGATIKTYPAEGENVELTTDEDGTARWKLSVKGSHSLYVGTTTQTPGETNGKKYETLKDYATLTFRLP
jgi:hypothetical protein